MNDKIEEILGHPLTIPALTGIAGFAGGLGLGFVLWRQKTEIIEAVELHEVPASVDLSVVEVDAVEEASEPVRPPKVVIDEKAAMEKGIIKVNDLASLRTSMVADESETEEAVVEETTTEVEVSSETDTEPAIPWDWEEELGKRTSTAPYILHKEEFYNDELHFTQTSLAYYAVDGVLVDEDEAPVYNHSTVTGEMAFGHGSGQENVVYIRNHELRAEYEVTRLDESYEIEVLGFEMEKEAAEADLKHSKLTKFRMD